MNSFAERLGVTSCNEMGGGDLKERKGLLLLLDEAKSFLENFSWCKECKEEYFGFGVAGVVAVFLLRIRNSASPTDEWLWVVVGDLPPAYIVVDDNDSPRKALAAYVSLMRQWVEAALVGKPVGKLIPVNVAATPKNASALRTRLDFLQREFLQ